MALGKCRECGKEVSSGAPVCPHCGVKGPIRATAGVNVATAGVGIAILLGITYCLGGFDSSSDNSPAAKAETSYYAAYSRCNDELKLELKAPGTAVFSSERESRHIVQGDSIMIAGYVDAENSFGAKLRSNWVCVVRDFGASGQRLVSATMLPR
jgi:hypothetical protein